eukprot:CAMPEP_0201526594 /NCGR_PEP_ID=MMETSP0161_2-20130828/32271_1 /ASSEMBLY_ACC=CAM_ASM_000251 /TAXON_ID=180227 /ORGANISM="Neoparamoeba aestuarina, Strain SoJaBio B1-5/56/2" /LENGTH=92 /DNA_ID=CAMNT_0047927047 /DNA_START=1404 /DNA_END=1679 /DNA_ORIENTATION=+
MDAVRAAMSLTKKSEDDGFGTSLMLNAVGMQAELWSSELEIITMQSKEDDEEEEKYTDIWDKMSCYDPEWKKKKKERKEREEKQRKEKEDKE